MSFNGKVVIVTGSGKGIGRCIALTYASEGAKVVVADKNSDLGSDTERQIISSGGIAFFKQTYVSRPGDIEELAAFFSPDHIRVNCISPGWIETGDYSLLRETDHIQHLSGRVGKPEDIVQACLYLTADGNDFINGSNLIIDGGMTRKMIYEP